jgi:hypothetical protein
MYILTLEKNLIFIAPTTKLDSARRHKKGTQKTPRNRYGKNISYPYLG